MTDRISWTSSAPTTEFILEADRISQSISGNYTVVRVYIKAINRGSTSSYSDYSGSQTGSIDGIWGGGTYAATPFLPSGYSNGAQRWRHGPWEIKVPHGSNGTRGAITLRMGLDYGNGAIDKSLTASFNDFPDLKSVPPAPTPITLVVNNNAQTTIPYSFKSNGDGGSSIIEWQVGYGTSSTTYQNTMLATTWTPIVSGLTPGKTYYFWVRGRNAIGWGNWSSRTSSRTIAGARIKVAGAWKEAIPYIRVLGTWKIAQPYVRVSGKWKKTS